MIDVWPAYPQRCIARVLRKCIYRLPFRDLLQFFVDLQRGRMEVTILQHQYDLIDLAIHHIQDNRIRRRRKRRRRREVWVRPWIGRQRQFGLYDQLLVELRNEDQRSFKNFMRMPPEMFDDLLARVGPRITKQYTWYREPLEPGLKLALTLRHLASGSKYSTMKYGWRAPTTPSHSSSERSAKPSSMSTCPR
jgi:hypothetical protein